MSGGPPPDAPSGGLPVAPAAPYAPPPPPPRRGSSATTGLVVVVVVLVVAAVVGVFLLSALLAGVFAPPVTRPVVALNAAPDSFGNATVTVLTVTEARAPENFRVQIQRNVTFGPLANLPAAESFVSIQSGSLVLNVWWIDGGDGLISDGDQFRVTGDGVPLPASTTFVFQLRWSDGGIIGVAGWTT